MTMTTVPDRPSRFLQNKPNRRSTLPASCHSTAAPAAFDPTAAPITPKRSAGNFFITK